LRRTLVLLGSNAAFTEVENEADKGTYVLISLLLKIAYSIDYQLLYKD